MTDDKVMAWLKDKEMHIKNKAENHMYVYGVALGVSDLPYINRLKHILSAKRGMKTAKRAGGGVMAGDNFCPSCGSYLGKYYLPNYCSDCGQKIEREGDGEVADKIKLLLKLERLHDTYCPDYKPNWLGNNLKYIICKQYEKHEWTYGYRALVNSEDVVQVYFPTKEIAQKVCDILNEELKQNSAR